MDEGIKVGMQERLIADLTTELKDDPAFDADILASKVIDAIYEVKLRRNYGATSYTENQIAKDLENYYPIIKKVALYDYNQRGVEGQSSHSENGTNRSWTPRETLFNGVVAFVKIL